MTDILNNKWISAVIFIAAMILSTFFPALKWLWIILTVLSFLWGLVLAIQAIIKIKESKKQKF